MTHLSDQNRALVERDVKIGPSSFDAVRISAGVDIGSKAHLWVDELNRLLDAARAEGRAEIMAKIAARKAIYEAKAAKADPLADDSYNRHDYMTHTVEAFGILQDECGGRE